MVAMQVCWLMSVISIRVIDMLVIVLLLLLLWLHV